MRKLLVVATVVALLAGVVVLGGMGSRRAEAATSLNGVTITSSSNLKHVEAGNGVIFTFKVTTTNDSGTRFSSFAVSKMTGGTGFYYMCAFFGGWDSIEQSDGGDCEYSMVTPSSPGSYTVGVRTDAPNSALTYPRTVSATFCVVFADDVTEQTGLCKTAKASVFW